MIDHGNNRSTGKGVKARIKDQDAAFMKLPVEVRRALQEAPVNFTLNGLQTWVKKMGTAQVVALIEKAGLEAARKNAKAFYPAGHPNATMEKWTPIAPRPRQQIAA